MFDYDYIYVASIIVPGICQQRDADCRTACISLWLEKESADDDPGAWSPSFLRGYCVSGC